MRASLFTMLLVLGMSVPALAQTCATCRIVPAPGPLMGAGVVALPVLLIGGGIYWLVRRKKTPVS